MRRGKTRKVNAPFQAMWVKSYLARASNKPPPKETIPKRAKENSRTYSRRLKDTKLALGRAFEMETKHLALALSKRQNVGCIEDTQ